MKYLIKDNIRDGVNAVKYVDSEKGEKIEGAVDYMKEVALMESEARKKSGEYHPLYSSSRQGKKKKRNSSLAHSIYTKHGESIVSCTMKGDDDTKGDQESKVARCTCAAAEGRDISLRKSGAREGRRLVCELGFLFVWFMVALVAS